MSFFKRNDGLGPLLLPFDIPAAVMAVLCTRWSGAAGLWAVAMAIASWLGWLIALLVVFVLLVGVMSLTVNTKAPPPEEDHPIYRAVVVCVIGLLCRAARLRIRCEGFESMPEGRFLIVSNHRSGYDPIATVWALRKRPTAFITKPENLRIPIAGPMIYKANYLPIDRENPRRAMATIQNAAALLKNDVVSVGVYPEGTRSRTGEMTDFHSGVFKIAQKAGVPVAVMTVSGTENIKKNVPLRHTDVRLRLCAVMPPEELSGTAGDISTRVRKIMETDLAGR